MKMNDSQKSARVNFVRIPVHRAGIFAAALAASAALFLFCGPSFAQNTAKQRPMTGRTSSVPAVSESVAPAPTPAKPAPKTAALAVQHAPAVAYLLLESAQGPVNGDSTDAMHRNWIAVNSIDKGSISDGAAKGQASDGIDRKGSAGTHSGPDNWQQSVTAQSSSGNGAGANTAAHESSMSGTNPLYESKDAMDQKNIADGAAKGQATEGMDHKNISDGAAKGQAVDGMARNKNVSDGAAKGHAHEPAAQEIPDLDASSKDAAKMDAASGASSGSHNGSFTVTKEIDKATPMLRQASVSGNHFPSAQLDVLDGGVWHHYQLTDVTVTSTQNAGGGSLPAESISFTYQKIEMK